MKYTSFVPNFQTLGADVRDKVVYSIPTSHLDVKK